MKRFTLAATIALVSVASLGASKNATEAWVLKLLNGLNGGTNGVITIPAIGTNGVVSAKYEPFDTYALGVTNSTLSAFTNGLIFAYVGNGIYTNANNGSGIVASNTNLFWNGIYSVETNGVAMFGSEFGVVGTRITSRMSEEIKGVR